MTVEVAAEVASQVVDIHTVEAEDHFKERGWIYR